jgi:hypothetical protein
MYNFTTVYLQSAKMYIKANQLYLRNTTQLYICSFILDFIFKWNTNFMWAAKLVINIEQLCLSLYKPFRYNFYVEYAVMVRGDQAHSICQLLTKRLAPDRCVQVDRHVSRKKYTQMYRWVHSHLRNLMLLLHAALANNCRGVCSVEAAHTRTVCAKLLASEVYWPQSLHFKLTLVYMLKRIHKL